MFPIPEKSNNIQSLTFYNQYPTMLTDTIKRESVNNGLDYVNN